MGKYWLANIPNGALLAGSEVEDMPSITTGNEHDFDVTVTGCALGDMVLGVSFDIDLDPDCQAVGYVSAADTVTVVVQNDSGATADFASATCRLLVLPSGAIDSIIA